jgi:hypothetical protein
MNILNKFFLKREEGKVHGGVRINFMTHPPRSLTTDDALTLAADLIVRAGGLQVFEPYIVAAYGGKEKFDAAMEAGIDAKNLAEAKKMASASAPLISVPAPPSAPKPVTPPAPPAPTPAPVQTAAAAPAPAPAPPDAKK